MNDNYPLIVYLENPLVKYLQSRQDQKPNKYGFAKYLWNQYTLDIFHLLKDLDVRKQWNICHQIFCFNRALPVEELKIKFSSTELTLLFRQKADCADNTPLILFCKRYIDNLLMLRFACQYSNFYQKNIFKSTAFKSIFLVYYNTFSEKKKIFKIFFDFDYQITTKDLNYAKKYSNIETYDYLLVASKTRKLEECWLIWYTKYNSLIQWLPKELKDELVCMIKKKKRTDSRLWGPNFWNLIGNMSTTGLI